MPDNAARSRRLYAHREVGPEGVAYLAGRRRNGGPLTREAFESDLRREGFEVIHGGQKPGFTEEMHAHGDFDVRIMVLSGEITITGMADQQRSGPATIAKFLGIAGTPPRLDQGVAYIVGKVDRPVAAN